MKLLFVCMCVYANADSFCTFGICRALLWIEAKVSPIFYYCTLQWATLQGDVYLLVGEDVKDEYMRKENLER